MKKLACIHIALFFISCANVSEENSVPTSDIAESETIETAATTIEEAFPYATITEQKLQDYFDLVALKNKHPEFAETISQQLVRLTKDSMVVMEGQHSVDIKNLRPIGNMFTLNDTLQQQKFEYNIASRTLLKTDTLTVNIITKTMEIEGKEVRATKVIFTKN